MTTDCPFCSPDRDQVVFETDLVVALWDRFPASPGHLLIVPRRHVSDWYSASTKEQQALWESLDRARDAVLERHAPAGFNIGINVGEVAGQTVPHLHLHLIPRYPGDVADPTGGIRGAIPSKQNYQVGEVVPLSYGGDPTVRLLAGPKTRLLGHLIRDMDGASEVDLAVAFVLKSGVDQIEQSVREILRHEQHRIRILAGDYFDITEPEALRRLLDIGEEVNGQLEVRVFETKNTSFHPKAYLIHHGGAESCAYVGSSNLSKMALTQGVEWNYRVSEAHEFEGFAEAQAAFNDLYNDPHVVRIDADWVAAYAKRRQPSTRVADVPPEPAHERPQPREIQPAALQALDQTRNEGNQAGLVVLATGMGKTYLAAFDVEQMGAARVLFVAHREEILNQAREAFRSVFPDGNFGLLTGKEKNLEAQFLFASVQTISRKAHLQKFEPNAFDYIVVDEFHHAEASSYRRVLEWFEPEFLLGLTATPDRTDGADLLALCGENEVFRCDLAEGIRRGYLVPFRYFGVPDDIDYENIPWRSSRFDEEALTSAWATQQRAQNAFEQWQEKGGERTLAFCVSRLHASFMKSFFAERGVAVAVVHSGEDSDPRADSLNRLAEGELEIVFAVDMFNEGVDLPAIDTVLMLRPTESSLLWLQQLGRGLRKAEGKVDLAVIDYIGNHRTFLLKARTLFQVLNGGAVLDGDLRKELKRAAAGELELPEGCEVTYDTEVVNVLSALLTPRGAEEALRQWIQDFQMRHERRPKALEAYHAGFELTKLRSKHGSWFGFLKNLGLLSEVELEAIASASEFFEYVGVTAMTKSFKMVTLQAMLNRDALPGALPVVELTTEFVRIARRSAHLTAEVEADLSDLAEVEGYLRKNPIAALAGGKGADRGPHFMVAGNEFRSTFGVPDANREDWQTLAREMIDWRLGQYLDRRGRGPMETIEGVARVRGGRAAVEFPEAKADVLRSCVRLQVGDEVAIAKWEGGRLAGAVNESDSQELLSGSLRDWFGPDAGLPGREDIVVVARGDEVPELRPKKAAAGARGLEVGQAYSRKDVKGLLSPEKNMDERSGMVRIEDTLVLFVTLEKEGMADEYQYVDRFLSATRFQWQSQNRTRQESKNGQMIRDAAPNRSQVLLFVRKKAKIAGRTQPFTYCGPVTFLEWKGEKPITCQFQLHAPPEAVAPLMS